MKDNSQNILSPKAQRWGRIRNAIVLGAFVCLSALVLPSALASTIAVLLQDDFGGSGFPSSATWDNARNYGSWDTPPLDGNGHVLFANGAQLLIAKPIAPWSTAPTTTVGLRLTMTVTNAVDMNFGFSNFFDRKIELRKDNFYAPTGGSAGNWELDMYDGTVDVFVITDPTAKNSNNGTWTFNWSPTEVTLLFNNALVFDSAVNTPTLNGGAAGWQIPTAAMVPMANVFNVGANSLLDSVLLESTIPEPSTVFLVGIGGWLLWRRSRKAA